MHANLVLMILVAILLCLVMAGAWAVAMLTGKSGWIDAIWTFGVGAAGVIAALAPIGSETTPRQWLVAMLAAIWSLRLGAHIVRRTLKGGDDPRYAELKKDWGEKAPRALFGFLQIQAAAGFVLALSIFAAARNPAPGLRLADWLGVAIMAVALVGEAIADGQLARFAKRPANWGQVCDVGLWAWSRHPNYFFEWLGWVAYVAIAVDLSGAWPWGFAAIAAPILMYWLLVHVSGIPPLEQHMLRSRGDRFRRYQSRVNAFWPAPPHPARSTEEASR